MMSSDFIDVWNRGIPCYCLPYRVCPGDIFLFSGTSIVLYSEVFHLLLLGSPSFYFWIFTLGNIWLSLCCVMLAFISANNMISTNGAFNEILQWLFPIQPILWFPSSSSPQVTFAFTSQIFPCPSYTLKYFPFLGFISKHHKIESRTPDTQECSEYDITRQCLIFKPLLYCLT